MPSDLDLGALIVLNVYRIRQLGETSVEEVRKDGKELDLDLSIDDIAFIIARAHELFQKAA